MPEPLDEAAALALIGDSRLFDDQWYAAQSGQSFGSREEAISHWVGRRDPEASPHPLFEPLWIYPGQRWRRSAPDPLSFYLSRPADRRRSPHPLVDVDVIGPLADWLEHHSADELLPTALDRAPVGQVGRVTVLVIVDDLHLAVAWMRHLQRHSPDALGLIRAPGTAAARLLRTVAATLPSIRVTRAGDEVPAATPVTVTVQPSVNPPRWPWLPDLVAALDRPGVADAQPLLLNPDLTIAAAGASYTAQGVAPLLAGHPVADAERIAGLPLPAPWPGVLATRGDRAGDTVLVPSSRLIAPRAAPAPVGPVPRDAIARTEALWRAAGFEAPNGRPLRIREGRPALRWALDIAAPGGAAGTRWGDYHFARSLAAALERLGQWVALDHPETRGRPSRDLDDVVLTIRGLHRVVPGPVPRPGTAHLLWVISHPEDVSAEECAAHDAVFAASTTWAADRSRDWGIPVEPLLQCTDTTRFHPGLAEPDSGPRILFVGNARGGLRPVIEAALDTGTPVTLYGAGWEAWVPASAPVVLAGDRVANESLGSLYASAGLVLNDHWADMRALGFVSNRTFDVLATGARMLCDDVAGLSDVLPGAGPVWRTHADFARLTTEPFEGRYPDAAARQAMADRVVAEHSFDARAETLLETARRIVDSGP